MAGIANPFSFLKTVRDVGANISLKIFFDDHHPYTSDEIRSAVDLCRGQKINTILTTEKDAVRMSGFVSRQDLGINFLVLKIALKIVQGEEALSDRLHSLYRP